MCRASWNTAVGVVQVVQLPGARLTSNGNIRCTQTQMRQLPPVLTVFMQQWLSPLLCFVSSLALTVLVPPSHPLAALIADFVTCDTDFLGAAWCWAL